MKIFLNNLITVSLALSYMTAMCWIGINYNPFIALAMLAIFGAFIVTVAELEEEEVKTPGQRIIDGMNEAVQYMKKHEGETR